MDKKDNNIICIVFSRTNTKIGWIIRKIFKTSYNHVSICSGLKNGELYSFGRKTYFIPFVGGFVKENFFRLAYPQKSITLHIFEIPLKDFQKQKLNMLIDYFCQNAEWYLYNLFSFTKMWKGKEYRRDNAYDCVEFVSEILRGARIITEKEYAEIGGLKDLYRILEAKSVTDTDVIKTITDYEHDNKYTEKVFLPIRIIETFHYIWNLWLRKTHPCRK